MPISEGSLVPASTPTSGSQRAHPYTPVEDAVGSSSFEMVPPVRARAASERGLDDSMETVPITRANSSPSIIQVPTHGKQQLRWCNHLTQALISSTPLSGKLSVVNGAVTLFQFALSIAVLSGLQLKGLQSRVKPCCNFLRETEFVEVSKTQGFPQKGYP